MADKTAEENQVKAEAEVNPSQTSRGKEPEVDFSKYVAKEALNKLNAKLQAEQEARAQDVMKVAEWEKKYGEVLKRAEDLEKKVQRVHKESKLRSLLVQEGAQDPDDFVPRVNFDETPEDKFAELVAKFKETKAYAFKQAKVGVNTPPPSSSQDPYGIKGMSETDRMRRLTTISDPAERIKYLQAMKSFN